MTQQEKADEIWDKMKGFRVTNAHRKKCCLVAVDLIISTLDAESWGIEMDRAFENIRFYQEVKQIIQDK